MSKLLYSTMIFQAMLFVFVVDVIQQRSVLLLFSPDTLEHKIMVQIKNVHDNINGCLIAFYF